MSLQITGTLTEFLKPQTGTTKDGSNWIKQQFIVDTKEKYNNLYCFEVFGDEKVENLTKYQKVNDVVTVEFNVNTNEYQGKYYTTLSAWKITKDKANNDVIPPAQAFAPVTNFNEEEHDDLPFN